MKSLTLLPKYLIKRNSNTPENEKLREKRLVDETLCLARKEQKLGLDFKLKGKQLEPETIAKVTKWQAAMNEDTAKKLFIRNQALTAYKSGNGSIKETSETVIREVLESISVSAMSKAEIALHIGQLEKARALLAALTQGYEIAYAEEKEPEFKRNHAEREAKERKERKVGDTLSKLGVSKETLLAALADIRAGKSNPPADIAISTPAPLPMVTPIAIEMITCEKCQKSIASKFAKFHKC